MAWSHRRVGKATIQITPAHKRPPVIKKNFEGPPICNPAQDQEALFHQSSGRETQPDIRLPHARKRGMRSEFATPTASERRPTRKSSLMSRWRRSSAIGEVSGEGFAKLSRRFRLSFAVRDMDDDVDRLIGSQLARPTDDVSSASRSRSRSRNGNEVKAAAKQLSECVGARSSMASTWDCRCHFVPY